MTQMSAHQEVSWGIHPSSALLFSVREGLELLSGKYGLLSSHQYHPGKTMAQLFEDHLPSRLSH